MGLMLFCIKMHHIWEIYKTFPFPLSLVSCVCGGGTGLIDPGILHRNSCSAVLKKLIKDDQLKTQSWFLMTVNGNATKF